MRLDCDMGRGTLSEAEQICKRNPTIVRKLQEEQLEKNTEDDYETDEDDIMPTDFPDETLASDCGTQRLGTLT